MGQPKCGSGPVSVFGQPSRARSCEASASEPVAVSDPGVDTVWEVAGPVLRGAARQYTDYGRLVFVFVLARRGNGLGRCEQWSLISATRSRPGFSHGAAPNQPGLGADCMAQGTVKWFNGEKGFGFISQTSPARTSSVHYSEIGWRGHSAASKRASALSSPRPGRQGPRPPACASSDH